jgi:hypothetical protein
MFPPSDASISVELRPSAYERIFLIILPKLKFKIEILIIINFRKSGEYGMTKNHSQEACIFFNRVFRWLQTPRHNEQLHRENITNFKEKLNSKFNLINEKNM